MDDELTVTGPETFKALDLSSSPEAFRVTRFNRVGEDGWEIEITFPDDTKKVGRRYDNGQYVEMG